MADEERHESELATQTGQSVKIADDVVAIIAGIAANEVSGVASMSGNLVGGIGEMLGRKNPQKGIRVTVNGNDCTVDVYLTVTFGTRIPDVAQKVQESVKRAVENMTGLKVLEVNVHIQGVTFDDAAAGNRDVAQKVHDSVRQAVETVTGKGEANTPPARSR